MKKWRRIQRVLILVSRRKMALLGLSLFRIELKLPLLLKNIVVKLIIQQFYYSYMHIKLNYSSRELFK